METKRIENKEDLKDAYYVRTTVFVGEQGVPLEHEIDEYEDESTHIVIYDGNSPVATGRVRFIDGYAKLQRICVLKEYRKFGLGRVVVASLEKIAREEGYSKCTLGGQIQAKGFYEKLGYTQTSGEFLDEGIPHVQMSKQLSNND